MVQADLLEQEEERLEQSVDFPRSNRGPNGEFQCRFCTEDDFESGIRRYQHEQVFHPDELKAHTQEKNRGGSSRRDQYRQDREETPPRRPSSAPGVEVIGSVRMDTVTELTRKFARALHEAAPDMAGGKKKGLILAFDEASYQMTSNPGLLERFLNRCALTTSQVEYIKLIMLGMNEVQTPGSGQWSSGAGPQVMSFDPRTGAMVPMPIVMMGNQGQSAQNPMVIMSPFGGWGRGRDDERLTEKDVARIVKDALEEREERAEQGRHRHRPGFT